MTATILSVPLGMNRGGRTVTRWTRRLLVGAIAIMVPALAGCEAGFDAPTLQFHPASTGNNYAADGITIDNAFVLGPAPGATLAAGGQAGLFLSLEATNGDTLTKITATDPTGAPAASSVQLGNGPITLSPNNLVKLGGPAPLLTLDGLTKPLSGGETITLDFQFANAGQVTLTVPVVPASNDFSSYSPAPTPTTSASLSVSLSQHKHKARKRAATGAPAASASPSTTP
jgi:copper(I)-binding protein